MRANYYTFNCVAMTPGIIYIQVRNLEDAEKCIANMLAEGYKYLGINKSGFILEGYLELAFSN